MKNNRILALSIITLLGSAHGVATGVTLSSTGSSTPVQFAKELSAISTLTIPSPYNVVSSLAPTGVKVSPTNNVYVKFYLLNGAKFGSDLLDTNLFCKSADAAANIIVGINATKTLGGVAGLNYATFQLAPVGTSKTATLGTGCQLLVSDFIVSGLTDKSVSATVEYNDAGTAKVLSSKGKFITFTPALAVSYTPNMNPPKIDVAQSSKKFINSSTNTSMALLGSVKYDKIGSILNASGGILTPASALSTVKLTITGPAIGSVHTGNVGTSGVFLVAHASNCKNNNSDLGVKPTVTYSGTSVTFNGLSVTALVDDVNICIVNGANVIADGQITANLSMVSANNSMVPDLTATRNTLATLKKNGAATKALVLPDPNQTDKPYVRIYNIGSSTGRVLGTLYGVDGKAIASGVLSAALAPNATVVLGAPEIAKALGIAGWTGRPWLQIEAEFQGLRAQALIRSSTGVLTEFSDGACGTSALCGDAQ